MIRSQETAFLILMATFLGAAGVVIVCVHWSEVLPNGIADAIKHLDRLISASMRR
jgi:hypothetical protein